MAKDQREAERAKRRAYAMKNGRDEAWAIASNEFRRGRTVHGPATRGASGRFEANTAHVQGVQNKTRGRQSALTRKLMSKGKSWKA